MNQKHLLLLLLAASYRRSSSAQSEAENPSPEKTEKLSAPLENTAATDLSCFQDRFRSLLHHRVSISAKNSCCFEGMLIDVYTDYLTLYQSDAPFPVAFIPFDSIMALRLAF